MLSCIWESQHSWFWPPHLVDSLIFQFLIFVLSTKPSTSCVPLLDKPCFEGPPLIFIFVFHYYTNYFQFLPLQFHCPPLKSQSQLRHPLLILQSPNFLSVWLMWHYFFLEKRLLSHCGFKTLLNLQWDFPWDQLPFSFLYELFSVVQSLTTSLITFISNVYFHRQLPDSKLFVLVQDRLGRESKGAPLAADSST